jgi:hypothetical protein
MAAQYWLSKPRCQCGEQRQIMLPVSIKAAPCLASDMKYSNMRGEYFTDASAYFLACKTAEIFRQSK